MPVLATIRKQDLYVSTLSGALNLFKKNPDLILDLISTKMSNVHVQENGRRCVVVPKAAASKESRFLMISRGDEH